MRRPIKPAWQKLHLRDHSGAGWPRHHLPARANRRGLLGQAFQKLTYVLDGAPVYWSREPNAHQLMLFTKTLDELRDQIELEGLEP